MFPPKQSQIPFVLALLIIGFIVGNISIAESTTYNVQRETLSPNHLYTQTNFTNFVVIYDREDIYSEVTPEQILIEHNNSNALPYQSIRFIIEFNIGQASFSDFDIELDIGYNLSLPIYWGDLSVIVGSDYAPGYVNPMDFPLYFAQIGDPWMGAEGMLTVGDGYPQPAHGDSSLEYDLSSPNSLTVHFNRTGVSVLCEILKTSTSLISHAWDEDYVTSCNYIRIQLVYFTEVENFSFTLSNFSAKLDVVGTIALPPPSSPPPSPPPLPPSTGQSFVLPSISSIGATIIVAVVAVIGINRRKKMN